MMSIGWGYGANMLTKYLAEVGERTPLTAATCIDNPFDLEETTRSTPHHILLDQKLKTGLIDILRSNKVIILMISYFITFILFDLELESVHELQLTKHGYHLEECVLHVKRFETVFNECNNGSNFFYLNRNCFKAVQKDLM